MTVVFVVEIILVVRIVQAIQMAVLLWMNVEYVMEQVLVLNVGWIDGM